MSYTSQIHFKGQWKKTPWVHEGDAIDHACWLEHYIIISVIIWIASELVFVLLLCNFFS